MSDNTPSTLYELVDLSLIKDNETKQNKGTERLNGLTFNLDSSFPVFIIHL